MSITPYREESRPERTVYEITEAGGQALQQWLLGMLSSTERVFADFPAALSFLPLLEPEAVLRQLEARARMLEERLAETDTSALELPRLFLIEEEYVRTVTQADLEWVRSVIDDLRTGRLTWSEEWLQGFAEMLDATAPIDGIDAGLAGARRDRSRPLSADSTPRERLHCP